jgi:L-iditol 2-dehydrogenase
MRAAILHGKEQIRIEEIQAAALRPGEVRIAIKAALTCGTDLKVFRRGYHAKMILPPAVFGHELSGIISEVHPETKGWKPGDPVVVANSAPCGSCFHCQNGQENLCEDLAFLNGAYAESIVVPPRLVEKNLLRLAKGTSFRDAALTEPLACVVLGMEDLRLKGGRNVLVLGAGPIGLMFVVLAQHTGCIVTIAGRGQARLKAAQRLGAHRVVDVTGQPDTAAAVRRQAVLGFDAVIEAIGKPDAWEAAVQLVRKGGKVNFFGGCPAGTKISLDTGLLHYSGLTLLASFHHTPRTIRRALRLIEAGVIRADDFVDGEWPLSKLPELFQTMIAGNRAVKTLIQVQQ